MKLAGAGGQRGKGSHGSAQKDQDQDQSLPREVEFWEAGRKRLKKRIFQGFAVGGPAREARSSERKWWKAASAPVDKA